MIFNQAQDTVNNSGMSQAEITAFNNKFLKYEGNGKSGSEVKAMCNEVLASNADSSNANRIIGVLGHFPNQPQNPIIARNVGDPRDTSQVSTSKKYKVEMKYATADNDYVKKGTSTKGCIYLIDVTEEE